jgi:hypothetical protein
MPRKCGSNFKLKKNARGCQNLPPRKFKGRQHICILLQKYVQQNRGICIESERLVISYFGCYCSAEGRTP